MLFSQVIGQVQHKAALLQAAKNNHLSHALLLLAPEGAGGLPMAMALAQYLVCSDKKETDACGQCSGCKKAAQLIHPDIHFSYPVVPKKSGDTPVSADYGKEWREFILPQPYGNTYNWLQHIGAENKQGNITARECSEIIHILGLKSYESEYKIMIIWRPEYLRKEGNRLLKLLEEPPENTVFILVAEQSDLIINTILSRTQLIRMPPLSQADLVNNLQKEKGLNDNEARQIAALADGNYDAAIQLMEHNTTDYMTRLRSWLNALLGKNPQLLSKWITAMATSKMGREEQKQFLRYFINQLEYALRLAYVKDTTLSILPEEEKFAANMLKMADLFQMNEMIRLLDDACYHIERNANAKILFHALSIRLRCIFTDEPVPL